MFKPLLSRLGIRFSLVLLGSILATAALVALVALNQINQLGQFSADQNEKSIRALARDDLTTLIAERARHYQSIFHQAESEARLIAAGVELYLGEAEFYGTRNFNPGETLDRNPGNGIFTNGFSSIASGAFWDFTTPTPEIRSRINALSHVDPLLRHAKNSTAGAVASWVITADALSRYFPNTHHVDFLPEPSEFDFRNDVCFTTSAPENNPRKALVWNEIYQDSVGQGLVVTVSMPAYAPDGRFLASTGIDISVQRLVKQVLAGLGDMGFSFLVTEEGKLIAFPAGRLDLFGLEQAKQLMPGELLNHKLTDSTVPEVRQIADRMLTDDNGVVPLNLAGEPYLLAFQRLPATHWRLGYVAAESELLSSVHRTRQALDQARYDTTRSVLLVTLLLLPICFATTLFFFMRNLFTPVRQILSAIRRVARGDLNARVHISQKDELSELAEAVNDMTERLTEKQSFLTRAEAKYRTLFDNATVGLYRSTPSGQLLSANKTLAVMFGFNSAAQCVNQLFDLAAQTYATPQDREIFRRNVEQNDKPEAFECRMRRADGEVFWVETTAKAVRGGSGEVLFYEGSMIDITDRKQAEEYRKILARELIRIQEFERRRVALDLHDNVAQDLSALKIAFETLFDDETSLTSQTQLRALRCADILGKSIASVRNMAHGLRPAGLDQIGLVQTLADYCRGFAMTTELRVDFSSAGMDTVRLKGDAGIHVFRILQEALNNVRKHSNATLVKVRLVASYPNVILRVEDNGHGFDPAQRPSSALSERRMGLLGMRERTDMLGGKFDIQSLPGKGTRLLVEFPLPGAGKPEEGSPGQRLAPPLQDFLDDLADDSFGDSDDDFGENGSDAAVDLDGAGIAGERIDGSPPADGRKTPANTAAQTTAQTAAQAETESADQDTKPEA